jgi:hypothetical protein
MKIKSRVLVIFLVIIGMLISACAAPATAEPNAQSEATAAPTDAAVEATAEPTQGPTATVWPPVFDPNRFNDIRELDSFVVTITENNTVNGDLTQLINTIGYTKEPYRAYNWNEYSSGKDRTYVIGDMTYQLTGYGDWYISAESSNDIFYKAAIPSGNTERLIDAQFAGEEEYQGIAVYHFVLEPTISMGTNTTMEGDFYVAIEGNYVLYSHWKETSAQENFSQVYEVIEELSSINQLSEITIPADMQDMVTAAQLPTELELPLPEGSSLEGMIRYRSCCGVDQYTFATPKTSIDAFLDYYRNLEPTNGWTVSHIGHVSVHESDCEFSRECVIINKGGTQVVLYYNGGPIRVEFDWPHLFSPIS